MPRYSFPVKPPVWMRPDLVRIWIECAVRYDVLHAKNQLTAEEQVELESVTYHLLLLSEGWWLAPTVVHTSR